MSFGTFALRQAKIVIFVVLVLAGLGIHSYLIAPQSIFPTMSFSRIDVVADAGDLPPERVRVAVTLPLSTALQTLPSILRVRSTSSQGASELIAEFDPKTDPRVDQQYVQSAIASVRGNLPAAKNIAAEIVTPNAEPVVSYALRSHAISQAVLRQIAERTIVPAFYGTPGLGKVLVIGGPTIEFHVDLDPARLAAAGLSASDVSKAIAEANAVTAVGSTEQRYQRQVLIVDAALHDARSIAALGIPLKNSATVPLGSLGTVRLGVAPPANQAATRGEHAIIINAYVLAGADAVVMARAFKARFDGVAARLPADIAIANVWDQTTLIVDSQTSLRDAILIGALLAIIVIYLFLRSWRMTLVAAAVIPLAMAISIFALERAGLTLNLMSVGGLAVAVGLIIDDTIVVIENIARNLAEAPERSRRDTVALSISQLAVPMLASTLTTVVVFVPLALLSGVTGYFFRALAFTLGASLLVSLCLALFVAPVIASALLRNEHGSGEGGGSLARRYEPVLRYALGHRPLVFLAAGLVLVVTIVLLRALPSDFLPKMDEGKFEMAYKMPTGTTLAATDAAASTMERIIVADPAVIADGRITGIDTNGYSPTQPNTGTIRVTLAGSGRASYEDVSARLRDAIANAVPAANLDFHQILEDQLNDLSGSPSPIEIAIVGPDQSKLVAYADRLTDRVSKIPGVADAFDGVTYDDPTRSIIPAQGRLAALGVGANELSDALAARTQGTVATQVANGAALVPVRVRVGSALGSGDISSQPLTTSGGLTSIGALAGVGEPVLASEVTEENGQRLVRVTANIANVPLSAVIENVKHAIAQLGLPPGYSARIGGQYEAQQASFREFLTVLGVAVVLVFAVMLATFGSFRLPLVILMTIPLALFGVALGLFSTGTPFNVSSFMGLLMLVGIVVKNGILLIDVANKRRLAGDDVTSALVAAGKMRLRPIVMTTLAAIGGLFPLALGLGSGSELEKPLAIAVIGGLSTSTLFTLVVIPVLYAALSGGAKRLRPARGAVVIAAFALSILAAPAAVRAQPSPAPVPSAAPPAQPSATPVQPFIFAGLSLAAAQSAAAGASPDVAIASARLAEAQSSLDAARSGIAPAFFSNYAQAPQGNPPGPNIISRQVSAGVQLAVGDFIAYSPAVREAAFNLASSQADYVAAQAAERIKVVGLYFDALKARAVALARRDALALATSQLQAARVRVASGDAPQLDVVRANVAEAKATADAEIAAGVEQNALEALGVETATVPERLATTEPSVFPDVDAKLTDPAVVVARARVQRPELQSIRLAADAARAAIRSARAAAFPALTVSGGYLVGSDSDVPINAPVVNAQLTIPFGSASRNRVRAAEARALQAQGRVLASERQILLDIAASARTLGALDRARVATTRARQAAQDELRATQTGYRIGASSSFEVTTARSSYAQAVVDELSTFYDLEKARATLEVEVGG